MPQIPEFAATIEVMPAPEVDAFLQATTYVLARSGLQIEGLSSSHYGSNGQLNPAVGGGLTMKPDAHGAGYTMRWHAAPYELQQFGQYLHDDQDSYTEIRREINRRGQADYRVTWGQREPAPRTRRLQPETPEQQRTAEAVFVTVASDFLTALVQKLGAHPEIVDGIEWNFGDMLRRRQAEQERKGRSWLAKMGIHSSK